MKKIYLLFCLILLCFPNVAEEPQKYSAGLWSPDGQKLLVTQEDYDGVYYLDNIQDSLYQIAQGCGIGYKMNWSSDNSKIAFKLLQTKEENIVQTPVLYDTVTQNFIYLAPTGNLCGVPFFSQDGKISFSVGHDIYVLDSNFSLLCEVSIGHYANLCVISPDGNWVAYNNERDQIFIFSTQTLEKIALTNDNYGHYSPVWSQDSSKILVRTFNGMIRVIDVESKKVHTIDEGEEPVWIDHENIAYTKNIIEQEKVTRCENWKSSYCGNKSISEKIRKEIPNLSEKNIIPVSPQENITPVFTPSTRSISIDRSTTVISGVPYIHQVYDTPDWYNGHWACGASSALMAITYYKILPHWDCTVSVPYSHVSHYGRYVCEKYTYNGYTFNKMTTDPNGKAAYGGYGFICQNNWANTKSYMAEYFQKHGVASSVDWSPTWDELRAKVNNRYPMVILTSLTSAGHYILGIGYYNAQHTVVVNDPYGNKNKPGYPNYYGAGASYDWPGYNNGFKNMNTVHCFIYAK